MLNAETFAANYAAFERQASALSDALRADQASVPEERRELLTYHDAYAYFAAHYDLTVVGAIQVSSFEDPTPKDVARLIDQVKEQDVQAIFGSEVFPSPVLDQIARHGLIDLDIDCQGDLHIDGHHTVEDVGITFGQAMAKAVGDKKGLRRYGHAYVPLDEALSRVVIDFSGRPGLEYHVAFTRALIGEFDVDLVHEFFQGFVNHAQVTLHIDNLRGDNAHHQCETIFKAFARALRMAVETDPRAAGTIPSTKGTL